MRAMPKINYKMANIRIEELNFKTQTTDGKLEIQLSKKNLSK